MKKKFSTMKLQNRFLLILLLALTISATLFELLWLNKWTLVNWTGNFEILQSQIDDEDFWTKLDETAQNLSLPESSDDEAAAKAIKPLLDLADKYTSIYLYEQEDGLYITGQYAKIMDEKHSGFRTFFDLGYRLTDGEGEDFRQGYLQFQNGKAQVVVVNYQRALFIYPYVFLSLLLSVLVFLGIVLFFMNRKMREVLALEQEILLMSTGDLTHPVPQYSKDEIGILANELNHLRISLNENIVREQESRKANQDLITALSHDLRTPLTILTGYLEVLRLGRTPEKQADYLDRCLKKASDIKELTDQMFSYALVSEEQETPDMSWLSTDYIFQCIQENCDFISLAGFTTNVKIPEVTGILLSDKTMINRIFTNLFSNILKYGDKGTPVIVRSSVRKQRFTVTVSNAIKQEHSDVGSSNIGLRNVQRMMQMMDGEMLLTKKTSSDSPGNHNISQNTSSAFASENVSGVFEVTLWFPLR